MSENKVHVIVSHDVIDDNRSTIEVKFLDGEPKISLSESAKILAGGISLIVKLVNQHETEKKDYELMKEIIDYLQNEFVSLESFSDAYADPEYIKQNKDL
jgi:hypothetical protein